MFTTMFKDPEILDALTVISLQQGLEPHELEGRITDYIRYHLQDIARQCMVNHRFQRHVGRNLKFNIPATHRERKPVTLQIHQERNRR